MTRGDEFAFLDATAQATLVREKRIAPRELAQAAIARIERLNPVLNAVVTPLFAAANQEGAGHSEGPFAGVPFLLKDLLGEMAGVRETQGSRFLQGYISRVDSELVRRFRQAGLVILGKTNCPEFGILPTTEPALFGAARNPWNLGRTPGGSSGGSAAAVAAGLVACAHANDGGGSIRIPAACCGLFGLKPTRARVSLGPELGDIMGGLVVQHALTRSVRDSAALLDVIAGPFPGDPYPAPPLVRPFAREVESPPGRLRIAFSAARPDGAPHPDVQRAVADAATLCAQLGHELTEAAPAIDADGFRQAFLAVFSAGVAASVEAAAHQAGRRPQPEDLEPLTWALAEAGRQQGAADYLAAWQWLQRMARSVAGFFSNFDLWLTPTVAEPPPPLGAFDPPPDFPFGALLRAGEFAPYTEIANVTGQPAMSVPLCWNEQNLPIGVHFTARYGDEATLFRLAGQLERARPWTQRRPPLDGACDPGADHG